MHLHQKSTVENNKKNYVPIINNYTVNAKVSEFKPNPLQAD